MISFSLTQEEAKECLKELVGELIELPPGRLYHKWYPVGSSSQSLGHVRHLGNWVDIKQPYLMAKDDVTTDQHSKVMGINKSTYSDPNIPAIGLSYNDWEVYVSALNDILEHTWPIAYPGKPVPKAAIPMTHEIIYGNTEDAIAGSEYDPTAYQLMFLDNGGITSTRLYGVHSRLYSDGPVEVGKTPVNPRGFRNLLDNVEKITSTIVDDQVLLTGGNWTSQPQECNSMERKLAYKNAAVITAGLRLVFKYPEGHTCFNYKKYIGFTDVFDYCSDCGKKKE